METKAQSTVCESNLKKLYMSIERYISTFLKTPSDAIGLDISAVARGENAAHLELLCEHVLGIVGNCKQKEKFIDSILKLDAHAQAILMEIMVKYLSHEEQSIDSVMLESLQVQLREKEVERISMVEHLKMVEQENFNLARKFEAVSRAKAEITNENLQLKNEIEELRKTHDNGDFVQREKELESDIEYYQQEIKELRAILSEQNKVKQQEISKYNDDIYLLKEDLRKTESFKETIVQQKKQIQELLENEEAYRKQLARIPALEESLAIVEKRSDEFEKKNERLVSEYYELKSKVRKIEANMKQAVEEREQAEKEQKKLGELVKFWEEKARQSEETIRQLQEDSDTEKSISGICSLLTQEKEAEYQSEISRLQKEIARLTDTKGNKLGMSALELKAKLEVSKTEKQNLLKTLNETKEKNNELEKVNESLLAKHKEEEEKLLTMDRELKRTEKDREILLGLSKRAQVVLTDQDKAKEQFNKLQEEFTRLQNVLDKSEREKELLEEELKEQYGKNIELEKEISRKEEQNIQLNKYKENTEQTLQAQAKCIEIETESKLEETFKTRMKRMKRKYKDKISELKRALESKNESLKQLEEINENIEMKYSAIVKNLKEDYQTRLKAFSDKALNQIESAKAMKLQEHLLDNIRLKLNNYTKSKNFNNAEAQTAIDKLIEVIFPNGCVDIQTENDSLKENLIK